MSGRASASPNGPRPHDDLASWLRARREELGMTPTQLATVADVSRQTIYRYEKGGGYTDILKILDALGVELRPAPPAQAPRSLNAEIRELRRAVERLGRR